MKPRIVVNNLLMFVNSYRSRSAGTQIKSAVLKFYASNTVENARKELVDNVKDVIPNYPYLNKKRMDSANRSAKDVMVEDILDMFKALDSAEQEQMPKFVSDDASKLPSCPEAAGNMMSLYDDLAAQQRAIANLQESMTKVMKEVVQNTSDLAGLKRIPKEKSPKINAEVSRRSAIGGEKTNNFEESDPVEPPIEATTSYAGVASTKEPLELGPPSDTTQNKFQEVGPRSGKRPNKGQMKTAEGNDRRPQKTKGIGGQADQSDLLIAGPTQFKVQITNVNPGLRPDDIKAYLNAKQDNITPIDVVDTSSPDWGTKRFLLTFVYEHMNHVLAKEFWPKNIYFKRWFTPKSKKKQTTD